MFEQPQVEDHGNQGEGPVAVVADDLRSVFIQIGQGKHQHGGPDQGPATAAQGFDQPDEGKHQQHVQHAVQHIGCLLRTEAGYKADPVYQRRVEQPVADLPDAGSITLDRLEVIHTIVIDLGDAGDLP